MVPVGVGRQALEVDDPGPDGDILAEELYRAGPLQQAAAKGALPLIAHKDHGGLGPPKVVLQMVADAAGVAHAGGGDDDFGRFVVVESPGLLGGLGEGEAREGEQVFPPLNDGDGLLVQIALQVAGINLGGLGGQRGIHIHLEAGQGLYQPVPLDLPQIVQQLLGAAHGERDKLYWINNDIWSMDVTANRVPVRPFLEYRDTKYYGLTVNPVNGEVYVADAIDYQQQGMIYRYSPEGKLIDEFYVGIIPGAFCWK